MNSKFKRNKSGKVSVTLKDMTQGEALALCHALSQYSTHSPVKPAVADDVRQSLRHTIQQSWSNSNDDQELFEALGETDASAH
jgi:hypothetical protein